MLKNIDKPKTLGLAADLIVAASRDGYQYPYNTGPRTSRAMADLLTELGFTKKDFQVDSSDMGLYYPFFSYLKD